MSLKPNRNSIYTRAFIGFTIFDFLHLSIAIALLVHAYLQRPMAAMAAAECMVEIVFSFLLMAFISALAHHKSNATTFHALYAYCWLVATASLLVPLTFAIPTLATGQWDALEESVALSSIIVSMSLAFVSFTLFLITLIFWEKRKRWNRIIVIALVAIMATATAQFCSEFFFGLDAWELSLECVKDLAPVPAAILGLTLTANKNFQL